MNEDGTFYICEACREPVEPEGVGIIRAHELIAAPSYGSDMDESIEGRGVFFHANHYPRASRRYRRVR